MRSSLLVLVCLFLVAADAKEDAVKAAKAKLKGTWDIIPMEHNGKKDALPEAAKFQMVIDDDKLVSVVIQSGTKVSQESTYTLDPTQNPPHVDLVASDGPEKGKKSTCIYLLDKDELKIFLVEPGEPRPKEFVSKGVTKGGIVTLKRQKN